LLVQPNSDEAMGAVKADPATSSISGSNPVHRIYQGWGESGGFNGWFYLKTSKPFTVNGSFSEEGVFKSDSIANQKGAGVYAGFYLQKDEILEIRAGTSFCSWQGAKANLTKEVGQQSFEQLKSKSRTEWEKALGQIRIKTNNEQQKKVFYTALYHSMQHPRLFNDVDGQYPQFAGKYQLQKSSNGNYYDDFSMWDIYRAQLPLIEILDPALSNAFIRSLIAKGEQGGWLPIFPCWNNYTAAMIGDHVSAFIAAAYNKGLRNFNVQSAYNLMRKNAFETPADFATYKNGMGRRALPSYLQFGYIPAEDSVPDAFHKKEQVSRTLEYAYDDYALFTMARALGKKEDQQLLRQRALNYRNVFSTADGMVRGKHSDGKWVQSFHPDIREFYITEGTPRQYSFYVPHDIPGLATLMGGDKAFENALDSLFLKNEYWHGNEPGHQIPFLYNYTASPYKTQERVRQILLEEYGDGPGGLSGNDDAGQMSAWYVFAALGFYPVNPVSGDYQLTTPLFDQVQLQLQSGKKFSIKVHRSSDKDIYIKQVTWNGKIFSKNYITYNMIMQGGKLECWLSDQPGNWGSNPATRSKGLSNE
jgi:predicted alpha-1,2-mannosidase